MENNLPQPDFEQAAQLDEKFFSIGDPQMIFDVLRNKMYSKPVLAVCRELSCNARDSHREAGITDQPIHIHFPTTAEPYFKVQDFGLGISPDQIENVFIKYGTSTKRNNAGLTGMFGLGSKSPFAISDTFFVHTNYDGICYQYSCFVDETQIGKISLLSQFSTQDHNGTTILVPIKGRLSVNDFIDNMEKVTRHWDVKPIFFGQTIQYKINKILFQGDDWFISQEPRDHYDRIYCKIIVDGIEYPVLEEIKNLSSEDSLLFHSLNRMVCFQLKQISLSANREAIYLDHASLAQIKEKITQLCQQLIPLLQAEINQCPTFWDAQVLLTAKINPLSNDNRTLSRFIKQLSYHGHPLVYNHILPNYSVFLFEKIQTSYGRGDSKIRHRYERHLRYYEDNILIFNDLNIERIYPRHLSKIFDTYPVKSVQVINPKEGQSLQDFTSELDNYPFSLLNLLPLSNFNKKINKTKSNQNRLTVFRYHSWGFSQCTLNDLKSEKNTNKVLCLLGANKCPRLESGQAFNMRELMTHFQHVAFYGIPDHIEKNRLAKISEGFLSLDQFLDQYITNNHNIDFIGCAYANSILNYDAKKELLDNGVYQKMLTLINNPENVFMRKQHSLQQLNQLTLHGSLLFIYQELHQSISNEQLAKYGAEHPELNFSQLEEEYQTTYPMLRHIAKSRYLDLMSEIVEYINDRDLKIKGN